METGIDRKKEREIKKTSALNDFLLSTLNVFNLHYHDTIRYQSLTMQATLCIINKTTPQIAFQFFIFRLSNELNSFSVDISRFAAACV